MGVTGFTFVLLPLCLLWIMQPSRLLKLMLIAGVFEAAAALALGGVGLQPALVPALFFIGFMALQLLLGARYAGQSEVLALTRPFLLVTLWALTTSFIMPRVFEGVVYVWPQKSDPPFVLTALAPTSSNINQDIYLTVNCTLLLLASMYLTTSRLSLISFMRTYLISGFVAAGVAFWQFANKLAHVPYPDALFYSNPGWSILTEQSIGSIPRINGPFSEPSSLGGYMGAIVCATGWQMLQGHRSRLLLALFATGLMTMLLSTSTTGFGVLAIAAGIIVALAVLTGSQRMIGAITKSAAIMIPLVVVIYIAASVFVPSINDSVAAILATTMNKQQSSSYEGRTSTDLDSIAVAVDTYGLGAGWGSNRSSSLIPGLLSAIGVPGCLGLLWFGFTLGARARRARRSGCPPEQIFVIDGCCGALVGFLIAAILSGPTITSVTFFFLVALLAACIVQVERQSKATRPLFA